MHLGVSNIMYFINKKNRTILYLNKPLSTMLEDINLFPSTVSLIYTLYTTLCNEQLLKKSFSCWKALHIHSPWVLGCKQPDLENHSSCVSMIQP